MAEEKRKRRRRSGAFRKAVSAAAAAAVLALGCEFLEKRLGTGGALSPFPHAAHVEDQGLECGECHEAGGGDSLTAFPARETCEECHDPGKEKELFGLFFTPEGGAKWVHAGRQAEEIRFDHALHEKATGGDCLLCHREVVESEAITARVKLRMDTCLECHKEKKIGNAYDCSSCHSEIRRDRRPPSHRDGWIARHGEVWRCRVPGGGSSDRCELCHEQGSCDDCHTTQRPKSHNTYWRGRGHGIAAGIDRSRCYVCHQRDTCDRCHSRKRPRSHRGSFGDPRNRHCLQCHMPVDQGESCGVCHLDTPSHERAEGLPSDDTHRTATAEECRSCHAPLEHPDNGDDCRFCHQ